MTYDVMVCSADCLHLYDEATSKLRRCRRRQRPPAQLLGRSLVSQPPRGMMLPDLGTLCMSVSLQQG